MPNLQFRRKFANAVILPDRSILVTGGGRVAGHGSPGQEEHNPEVYRGGTAWETCSRENSPRTYHATAVLLPSGRVASMGGDTRTSDLQVFEPHYFQIPGPRPVINNWPGPWPTPTPILTYNATFAVDYTLDVGRTLASACLIAPGSVTHGHDPNQRHVELPINSSSSTQATLQTPLNATRAPYGYYMLFLVDDMGAVSAAEWVQL